MTAHPPNPVAPTLQRGDRLGKYEIVGQIGAGGMSVVWKGVDRLLDRPVAIKQMLATGGAGAGGAPGGAPDGGPSEGARERFIREAELQKRVARDHKHLVQVIELLDDA